jgi:pyruvate kinase
MNAEAATDRHIAVGREADAEQAWDLAAIDATIEELFSLRAELLALQTQRLDVLRAVHPDHAAGAVNLVHYLGLRRRDVRALQERLAWLGVSSLGRAESHVLANLDKVLGVLHRLAGRAWSPRSQEEPAGMRTAARLLESHAAALLGPAPVGRSVRVMVTLDSRAGADYPLVHGMLAAGVDCVRINCAHDDQAVWAAMLANVVRARQALQRPCRILFDLAGPKLRVGEIEPRPAVLKLRPVRDEFGQVVTPARVLLQSFPGTAADAPWIEVDARWLTALAEGERIDLTDARGARRTLSAGALLGSSRWAQTRHTAYIEPGTALQRERPGAAPDVARVLAVPEIEGTLRLRQGDALIMTRSGTGRRAQLDAQGRVSRPACVACTLPAVLGQVHPGERVWFDDGRIGGVIRHVQGGEVHVEITVAREEGEKLTADKGINLPDSTLDLAALTDKDLEDLEFVARHGDMVGLSFVRRAGDVDLLQGHLARLNASDLGIVLKIENRSAFARLPELLLAGMRSRSLGVMIARGDLAVEVGWERLAEVQEEILWLAEAAHVPVIWATQVLETLTKRGLPSRAEITDAAMGERAECVMLNKGPHILDAVQALGDILCRMQAHQHKKRAMLRQLHW